MRRDQEEQERDAEHGDVAAPPPQVDALEGAIAERADHQEAEHDDEREHGDRLPALAGDGVGQHEHDRGDLGGAGRDRQAHEVASVDDVALDVEAGQAQDAAHQEEERRRPARAGDGDSAQQ